MNLHGAHLLAALLCEDHDAMNHHLTDPDIEAMRQQWLEGARRGEHWLLSYEAIRCAALAWTGEFESARRNLAVASAMIGTDAMSGLDADLLGAFAWVCLQPAKSTVPRAARRHLRDRSITETDLLLTEARGGQRDHRCDDRVTQRRGRPLVPAARHDPRRAPHPTHDRQRTRPTPSQVAAPVAPLLTTVWRPPRGRAGRAPRGRMGTPSG